MPTFINYSISTLIGEGGMAKVYLATHNTLGHQVAIKVLNKDYVFNSNIRSRFIEEAKKMGRMNHSNLVKVTDLIGDENTIAIVMEYVQGKTLKQILEEKKLKDDDIEFYFKQMAKALEYLHLQGLIHRDVKPSNFILSNDGHLKLTDFGISKSLDTENIENIQTGTTVSLGTPMYMSPEQVRSTKDVTFLTDIFSLGVVLWEMVSGKKPYGGNTLSTFDLQLKIVQEGLALTNTFWDIVIQKAIQKDETKRFQSAKEFLLALDNKSISDTEFNILIPKQKPKKENQKRITYFNLTTISIVVGILLFVGILIFSFSNAVVTDSNETTKLKIGQKHQGGIIFYLENSGEHGKVCTERNLGQFHWYAAILECQNLNLNGYSDWYLPAKDDLKLLYVQRHNIRGLSEMNWWSCTEYDDSNAYIFYRDVGYADYFWKSASRSVRAVRYF